MASPIRVALKKGAVTLVPDIASEVSPGHVRVQVYYCGVCGTDIHNVRETTDGLPGHEFSGVVAELGKGIQTLKVGDRVVVEPLVRCGTCLRCQQGKYHLCDSLAIIGGQLPGALNSAGFTGHFEVERRYSILCLTPYPPLPLCV